MNCGYADCTQIAVPMIDDEKGQSESVSEPRKNRAYFGLLMKERPRRGQRGKARNK